jgi:hypothetical protein
VDDTDAMGMAKRAEEIRHFFGEEGAPGHEVRVSVP